MAGPPAYAVQGELQRQGDIVTGWCWSPERPTQRLVVDLRIDGHSVAAVVAARLRLDLVRDGICDGYHAFTIALPVPISNDAVIETSERETGRVFGRVTSGGLNPFTVWLDRAESLSSAAADLREKLPGQAGVLPLRHAVGFAGRILSRGAIEAALPCRIRYVAQPASSLVLDGTGGASAVTAAIGKLAPLLEHHESELVVAGPGVSLVEGVVNAVPCFFESEVKAWQAVACVARGERLVFLRAADVTASGVATLLRTEPEQVVLGFDAMEAARLAGLRWRLPKAERAGISSGLRLMVCRRALERAGGFDPEMDDGAGLHIVDLGLRLLQLGYNLTWSSGHPNYYAEPVWLDARTRFAARWTVLQTPVDR